MGIEAIFVGVALFLIARVLKQVNQRAGGGASVPPRTPGAAPETMAELWQEMREQLEAARRKEAGQGQLPPPVRPKGNVGRTPTPKRLPVPAPRFPAPAARFPVPVERGGSIEVASREVVPQVVDQDDGVEALVQRRIDAAAARNGEWQVGDHDRFDAKIRTVAPAVPVARLRHRLREAIIWREVLAPPVSLRQIDER